jgi:hypothetical protein
MSFREEIYRKTAWFGIGSTIVGILIECLNIYDGSSVNLPRLDISYEYLTSDPQLICIFANIGALVPPRKNARIPYLGIIHSMDKLVGFKNALVLSKSIQLDDRVRGYNLYMVVTKRIRRFLSELHHDQSYDARTIVVIEKQICLLTTILSSYYAVIHSVTQDGRI